MSRIVLELADILEITKSGRLAAWEAGGAYGTTCNATIIANHAGHRKTATYVRKHGNLSNDFHALLILERGDFVLTASGSRSNPNVEIVQVQGVVVCAKDNKDVVVSCLAQPAVGEKWVESSTDTHNAWVLVSTPSVIPTQLGDAMAALRKKANDYHCRQAWYIK